MKKEYTLNCKKCGKQYKLELSQKQFNNDKYTKFCSRSCANSRIMTQQDKLKRSIAAKNSSKVKQSARIRGLNKIHERKEYKFNCHKCGKQYTLELTQNNFKKGNYRKNCSLSCANSKKHSQHTKRKISNGINKYCQSVKVGYNIYPRSMIKKCKCCGKYFYYLQKSKYSNKNYCSRKCVSNGAIKYSTPFSKVNKDFEINGKFNLDAGYKAYIYKTTNLINNKFYIGMHVSNDIENDNYIGSGFALKNAIKKYGKQNFKRIILKQFDNYQDAFQYQKKIVNQQLFNNTQCYNLTKGGSGGPHFKNKKHSKETKKRMSKNHKNIQKVKMICKKCGKQFLGIPNASRLYCEECRMWYKVFTEHTCQICGIKYLTKTKSSKKCKSCVNKR